MTEAILDVLIDVGSYETKIGIAGEDTPKLIIPTIYADTDDPIIKITSKTGLSGMGKERYYGKKALKFKDTLLVKNILQEKDFSSFTYFLKFIFKDQNWNPQQTRLIILYPSYLTKIDINNLNLALYDILRISKLAFIPHSAAILTALEKDTGTIIDMGHFSTRIEGIFKGFPNFNSKFLLPLGGYHITQYLVDVICAKYVYSSNFPLFHIAESIKHDCIETRTNLDEVVDSISTGSLEFNKTIYLPDGNQLIINNEKFLASELYFLPELAHIHADNLTDLLEKSIRSWERDQIPYMLDSLIICGNSAQIPNLPEKILFNLKNRFPNSLNINLISNSLDPTIIWKGGSKIYKNSQGRMDWQ